MPNGKVKWFDPKKGYGFITQDEGKDLFVHFSEIRSDDDYKSLDQNQAVSFDVVEGHNGLHAKNVVPIKS